MEQAHGPSSSLPARLPATGASARPLNKHSWLVTTAPAGHETQSIDQSWPANPRNNRAERLKTMSGRGRKWSVAIAVLASRRRATFIGHRRARIERGMDAAEVEEEEERDERARFTLTVIISLGLQASFELAKGWPASDR